MEESGPSRTALRVALRRAAHQIYDPRPLLLDDPLAVTILGSKYAEELRKTATRLHKPSSVALRAFLVARSRYAEDQLAAAVARGVTQYILLGAGLDTFAYRNPHTNLQVFEVDRPATQQWKRNLLRTNAIPIPPSLRFVPVDFETQALESELMAAGFNPAAPAFFALLGVVPYLTIAAFRSTLAFIAQSRAGSGVVLDYAQPRHVLPPLEQLALDSLASRVALAGEPFQLFFTPQEIAPELSAFHTIEDLGSSEINARYLPGSIPDHTAELQTRGATARLLSAWVERDSDLPSDD
jgi:methyltransferase (TIGR00027 family)